jgi:hypothetical protein
MADDQPWRPDLTPPLQRLRRFRRQVRFSYNCINQIKSNIVLIVLGLGGLPSVLLSIHWPRNYIPPGGD